MRAFRHTSTLALYQIVDSSIEVIKEFKANLKKTEKQLRAAKKKKNKDQERELKAQSEQQTERISILEDSILKDIFEGVFSNRYKDSVNHIRALSIESLGEWIIHYPEYFLGNKFLKYIGWTLNDRDQGVREIAIKTLSKLYHNDDFISSLSSFTAAFMGRFVELTSDISINVAVAGIKLMTDLLRKGILAEHEKEEQYIEDISALIFDENASIRYQAAKFVFYNLSKKVKKKKKPRIEGDEEDGGKKKRTKEIKLDDLLEFMAKYSDEMPSVAYYIVDSLWDMSDVFTDWEEICEKILSDEDLEDDDTLNLIRLLNASVQKLKGELKTPTSVSDTIKVKVKTMKKEEKEKAIEEMTNHVAPALPQIIAKFQTDAVKVAELIEIPQHFDLTCYVTNRMEHVRTLRLIYNNSILQNWLNC